MKLGTWKARETRDIEAKRLGEIVEAEGVRETRNIEAKWLGEIVEAKRQETLKARGLER